MEMKSQGASTVWQPAVFLVDPCRKLAGLRPATTQPYTRRAPIAHLLDAKGQSIAPTNTDQTGDRGDFDVLLGELIFSPRDPREDVARAPENYSEDFLKFVTDRAEDSDDMEEREGLKSLVDMIRSTLALVEKAEKDAEEAKARAQAEIDAEADRIAAIQRGEEAIVDTEQVLGAAAVASGVKMYEQMAKEAKEGGPGEAGLYGDALKTYDKLLGELVQADAQGKLEAAVEGSYERCDFSLLSLAAERRDAGDRPETEALSRIIDAINALSAKRLQQAAERLGKVMKQGSPELMFAKITELAIINQIDAPLVELLEANRQQALAAGAAGAGAAELMKNLANRCRDEMDKRLAKDAPEKRLLRALLRTDDDEMRRSIIERAFEQKEGLALSMGDDFGKNASKKTKEGPEVEPPKFIAACQQLIAEFGNMDDNGQPLMVRINEIATIAESVATELYGDISSAREQQDLMWNEATTSIFDLEAAELAAETKGETMPWHNDSYDGQLPDGFTADQAGNVLKRIGGS